MARKTMPRKIIQSTLSKSVQTTNLILTITILASILFVIFYNIFFMLPKIDRTASLKKELENREHELIKIKNEYKKTTDKLKEKNQKFSDLDSKYKKTSENFVTIKKEKQQALVQEHQKFVNLQSKYNKTNEQLKNLKPEYDQTLEKLREAEKNNQKFVSLTSKFNKVSKKLESIEQEKQQLESKYNEANDKFTKLTSKYNETTNQLKSLEQNISKKEQDLKQFQNQLKTYWEVISKVAYLKKLGDSVLYVDYSDKGKKRFFKYLNEIVKEANDLEKSRNKKGGKE